MGDESYVHGTSPQEQRRLSLMNDLINAACVRELRLRDERAVLDLGSGLGQFTRTIAGALAPGARVVGIERDPEQLAQSLRLAREAGTADLVDFRLGEAEKPPLAPAECGSFDLVHARFLLEHHRDPAIVARAMVAAARPGGRVVLADDDHDLFRLWPDAPR